MTFFFTHEQAQFDYSVTASPPPADNAKAVLHKHTEDGAVVTTKTLKKSGQDKVAFPLTSLKVEDSPLFVEFLFEKAKQPTQRKVLAFSLAEPEVAAIEAPADAAPGEQMKVAVKTWGGRLYDEPGKASWASGVAPERISAADKAAVKWRLDGAALPGQGASITATVPKAKAGGWIEVRAHRGPAPGVAATKVAVVKVEVRGGYKPPLTDPVEAPKKVATTGGVRLNALIKPGEVAGEVTWTTTSKAIELATDGKAAAQAEVKGKTVFVRGKTASKGKDDVTITCTFVSKATGKSYKAEHKLTVVKPFAVKSLQLEAGTPKSKTYLGPDFKGTGAGSDDFHFAPGVEKVNVKWKIEDAAASATNGTFGLRRKGEKAFLWQRVLKDDEFTDGEHTIEWDGDVKNGTDDGAVLKSFPNRYVTLEHAPYELVLELEGKLEGLVMKGEPEAAFTRFTILPDSLTLELGAKAVLGLARDRILYAQLGGKLPEVGKTQKLMLLSNLYKTANGEMNDNTAFTEHQTLWNNGPTVPIFVLLKLKDSKDAAVEAPKALGKVKFLWDYEDVAEDTSAHHAAAKTFLDAALDYDKVKTTPNGDNCHGDRGGKRGGGVHVFPSKSGYAPTAKLEPFKWPFSVSRCTKRTGSALSTGWGDGAVAGKSGVLFQPSRMGGDAYKITCYLAHEKNADKTLKLDVLAADFGLSAAEKGKLIKAETGTFEVWRQIHLAKYLKKTASVTGVNFAKVQAYYEKAYMDFADKSGGAAAMTAADYNARIAAAAKKVITDAKWKHCLPPATGTGAVDQHGAGDHAIQFRSRADFKTAVKANVTTWYGASWDDDDYNSWAAGVADTDDLYSEKMGDFAEEIIQEAAKHWLSAAEGVTILQFVGLCKVGAGWGRGLNGMAFDVEGASRKKCALLLCATASSYPSPPTATNNNTLEQTSTHEIGHHLFMPHSPDPSASPPGGAQAARHDAAFTNCTMSYNYNAERRWCGLCILRLRGWSAAALNSAGASNKRT
jgi:hypothetical protein